MEQPYRGRFAPSPTGPLHFGSLVAALASFLDARANGGSWLVRIEDLDPPRVVPGSAAEILRALELFGIEADGTVVYQSSRTDAYHAALHELRRLGELYPCACSRREIADSGVAGIEGYVYPRTCSEKMPEGRKARAWRVRTPPAAIVFEDRIQGRIAQSLAHEIGDFVLYRADRVHAYQLAVVLDDAEQNITDVVRGADLLDSTPRQIHLQRLLGLSTPRYAHVPVAVNDRGEKLSKQTYARALDTTAPGPALVDALRFLGQEAPEDFERAAAREIIDWATTRWRIESVPRVRSQPYFRSTASP